MPIKRSAYKELRKAKRRHARNIAATSDLKTAIKKFEKLLTAKKADEAKKSLGPLASTIQRAAAKGIIHANTASRTISRLARRLSSLAKA